MMRPLRLIGLTCLVVLAGCSKDEPQGMTSQLNEGIEAQPYVTEYEEMHGARTWEAPTRAAWTPPSPYVSYNDLTHKGLNQKDLSLESIGVFFTKDSGEPMEGIFFYQNSKWQLKNKDNKDNEDVNAGDYYLYGYIPREDAKSASIVPNGTYSNGAVLTIKELNSLTQSDVCIIVGAKEGTDDQTVTGLQTGSFLTHLNPTTGEGNHNYIFLLFEHLYSALRFNFTIDADYAALRTIKIRKLELVSYSDDNGGIVRAKYNAVITLKANSSGTSPIVGNVHFIPDENSAPVAPKEIYNWYGNPANYVTLTTSTPSTFMACFVPGENTYFKLRTTYDVFDREDVLIRQECQAENTIDLRNSFDQALLSASRGHCFSYTIKVQPTYAYQLSNKDIDNPELKISE